MQHDLLVGLPQALAAGEFFLEYQPIFACDAGQGFWLGPPLTASDFEQQYLVHPAQPAAAAAQARFLRR
ncbi:hypothetical protein [Castellaniella sp.]|uniref:hypothetical protein n=1 Tax=Castellaniella sp. TaxID=1955812 RepID=UPI003A8D6DB6